MKKVKRKPLIKIKSLPKEPKRQKISVYYEFDDYNDTLASIVEYFENKNIRIEDVKVKVEYFDDVCIHATTFESDEEYNKKLLKYEEKMIEFNKWYEENKELIDRELERRETEKRQKEEKIAVSKRNKLLKQKKILEKQLKKINKDIF